MIEKIQNKKLKELVKENLSLGLRWLSYEDNEYTESVSLEGIGDFNKRLYWSKKSNRHSMQHTYKKTGRVIDFSTWSEEMQENYDYYLQNDYNLVSIEESRPYKYITMYHGGNGTFMELKYSYEGDWRDTKEIEESKIRSYYNLLEVVESHKKA